MRLKLTAMAHWLKTSNRIYDPFVLDRALVCFEGMGHER